jgi:hypothetical protein
VWLEFLFFYETHVLAFGTGWESFILPLMPRTTSDVIDLAVRENRLATHLLYGFSVAFVLTGIALIVWSTVRNQPMMAIAGVADGALFWPAVRFADKTRRSNIMLRTLEIPLNRAQTAIEAAEMLQRTFEAQFIEDAKKGDEIKQRKGGRR